MDRYTIKAPQSKALAEHIDHCWRNRDRAMLMGLTEVRPYSNIIVRRHVEVIARQFQREFGYDFIQYDPNDSPLRDTEFLWHTHGETTVGRKERALGACVFRWHEWTDRPYGYALAWVWIHPYKRGNGLLKAAWPYFIDRFGEFLVEPPLSPAMQHFVKKHGTDNQWPWEIAESEGV